MAIDIGGHVQVLKAIFVEHSWAAASPWRQHSSSDGYRSFVDEWREGCLMGTHPPDLSPPQLDDIVASEAVRHQAEAHRPLPCRQGALIPVITR